MPTPISPASAPASAWCSTTPLLRQLNAGEVEAVLAHELGHFKHRHVVEAAGRDVRPEPRRAGRCWAGSRPRPGSTRPGRAAQHVDGGAQRALALLLFMLAVPVFGFSRRAAGGAPVAQARVRGRRLCAIAQTSGADLLGRAAQALPGQRLDAHARPGVRQVLLLPPARLRAPCAHDWRPPDAIAFPSPPPSSKAAP